LAEAAFWAFVGAGSLLIGAELALRIRLGRRFVGLVMAFGAGAMISAVAYELVLDALESNKPLAVVFGLALGSLAFYLGNLLIERRSGAGRKRMAGGQSEGSPLAIVLGAALDGVPESLIIGLTLFLGTGVSASFVAATFISNLPEAMAATTGLQKAGWPRFRIRRLWLLVVAVSVASGAIGYAAFELLPDATGAFVQSFAAGALLTMLADTMMPEAFEFGGNLVGLLTVAGFLTALGIAEVG
jgi:zinc transporter, ZIP family